MKKFISAIKERFFPDIDDETKDAIQNLELKEDGVSLSWNILNRIMTNEEKQLLLKDLCARLPYNLWVHYEDNNYLVTGYGHGRVSLLPSIFSSAIGPCPLIEDVKLYLRPMNSMTEKERKELSNYENSVQRIDFFYSHHIDCRFMIEKGLALEALKDMYKTE